VRQESGYIHTAAAHVWTMYDKANPITRFTQTEANAGACMAQSRSLIATRCSSMGYNEKIETNKLESGRELKCAVIRQPRPKDIRIPILFFYAAPCR
jgi:hypothetical protein